MKTLWNAGHVNRWHTNPCHALRNSQDTVHAHSARVALILWQLWPDSTREDILAALHHDLGESVTGDVSRMAKREMPSLGRLLDSIETGFANKHGLQQVARWDRIKLADDIDAFMWAASVPGSMVWIDADWIEFYRDIMSRADGMRVGDKVRDMLE